MAESQVSIDGQIRKLKDLFFTIATQNPVGSHGTYPLPEAQINRFCMNFSLGYLPPEEEVRILAEQIQAHPIERIKPCVSLALMKVAQALALFDGQEFVAPEQVQELAVAVIAHRLLMEPQARFSGRTAETVVAEILSFVPVPA